MCGIAGALAWRPGGLVAVRGEKLSPHEAVTRMVEALRHRGPDGFAVQALRTPRPAAIALGHARLAILDPSAAGRQPMCDPDTGDWLTHNGEVYNHRELRHALTPAPVENAPAWRSVSDTEVVLKAYARWGLDCLDRLRGMFAFGLWDAGRRRLFLARDRLGIKPLYYCAGDGWFAFASEVRALLASGLAARRLDAIALEHYLAQQSVPAPRTLVDGVSALPPGSWLTLGAGGAIEMGQYWDQLERAAPEAGDATEAESRRRVSLLLNEAVALHLVSDVPVAAFLSGGIDSSAVVALMRGLGHRPRTFTVTFSERDYDEARHARRIAERFRTDHSEIPLSERDLLDQLPAALAAMDQPSGDGVNTYVLARAVRSAGLTVALSGLGGDELFGGYPSFGRLAASERPRRLWGALPPRVRAGAASALDAVSGTSGWGRKLAALAASDGTVPSVLPLLREVFTRSERRALLADGGVLTADGHLDAYASLLGAAYAGRPQAELLTRISYAEARTYMHDVLLRDTDQMSMAHGLEVRVPFLDHRLVEYLMGLPDRHKRPNGTAKRLLVESVNGLLPGGLLPEEIVRRPKQGFALPLALWMRGALRQFCEERLADERIAARGLMRPEAVRRLWRAFSSGADRLWSRAWVLVVLEEWLERHGVRADRG